MVFVPTNASVEEPNLLDMLPKPSDCSKRQREMAIQWYARRSHDELNTFVMNTRYRIQKEFYQNPGKKLVGAKLHNLYAMREILAEAMRRKGAVRVVRATGTSAASEQSTGSSYDIVGTSGYIHMADI